MSTLPHDGLVVLRSIVPEEKKRRQIVVQLCLLNQTEKITSEAVDMVLAANGVGPVVEFALQEIADFINWI